MVQVFDDPLVHKLQERINTGRIAQRINDQLDAALVGVVKYPIEILDNCQRTSHFIPVYPGPDEHNSVVPFDSSRGDSEKVVSQGAVLKAVALDLYIPAGSSLFLQFRIVAADFQKPVVTGALFNDDHSSDDQFAFGSQVVVGEIEPQAFECSQFHRPAVPQTRILKINILFVHAADTE